MKSYDEFKEDVIAEGVKPEDADAWKKFLRAASDLENILRKPDQSLHALILNDIDHKLQKVRERLNYLDQLHGWKDKIRERGGILTQD